MKLFFEMVPLLLFLVAVLNYDIYIATLVLMVAVSVQMLLFCLFKLKIEKMHWVTFVAVLLFGGMTLVFEDPMFIKWKPTIVNWIFALVFIFSAKITGRSPIKHLLSDKIELPEHAWHKLNIAWICFFFVLGSLNIYVAYQFSIETWAQFKVFGSLGLTFLFMIAQGIFLVKYMPNEENSND